MNREGRGAGLEGTPLKLHRRVRGSRRFRGGERGDAYVPDAPDVPDVSDEEDFENLVAQANESLHL